MAAAVGAEKRHQLSRDGSSPPAGVRYELAGGEHDVGAGGGPGPPAAAARPSSTSSIASATVRIRSGDALDHGLFNPLIESVNAKIWLLTRIAFGFRSRDAIIALVVLSLGGHMATVPGRPDPRISR